VDQPTRLDLGMTRGGGYGEAVPLPRPPREAASSSWPVGEFWRWWREHGAARVAAAISGGRFSDDLVEELSRQVAAVHPDLQWELQPGTRARHRLCVSSGGAPDLRPVAERWRRAAPAATDLWEYASSRPTDPRATSVTFEWQHRIVAIRDTRLRAEVDDEHWRVHVELFHPAFSDMTPENAGHVGYLILDTLIGEDEVERWLGEVSTLVIEPDDAIEPNELAALIARFDDRPRHEWVLLEGRSRPGERLVAGVRRPLRWLDHWPLDLHHAVTITFSDRRPDGLPGTAALAELHRAEDALTEALGSHGLLVAHETTAGQRTLHLYTDSQDQNGADALTRWINRSQRAGRQIRATTQHDPTWRQVRHLD
jgi:hypothetical protein